MCGIGGILCTDGQPIPEEWLDIIDARIAYRGPDGCGRFRDRVEVDDPSSPGSKRIVEIALVHRRLSIIDHETGHQPMVSQRGRNESEGLVAVVFNGCIYNHRELRKELESKGHTFVTDHSDTEVLIHGWREWGMEIIAHLEGMYAFAIWDRSNAKLYLARDAFGEKPLYCRATETPSSRAPGFEVPVLAFASECASLMSLPAPEVLCGDMCQVRHWLVPYLALGYGSGMHGPNLIDIDLLPCASGRAHDARDAQLNWETFNFDLDAAPTVSNGEGHGGWNADDPRLYEGIIDRYLDRAVARRLEADVPLGCFLSGGVDSSLIAHFAMRHKPDLRTFSVRMPDPRYDESQHAEAVARHIGANHLTLDVAPRPAEDLIDLIARLGQPFGDSSILPTYWVAKAAREHVKVALSGDGGDELFMGYDRYAAAPLLVRHWRWLRLLPLGPLHRLSPKSRLQRAARFVDMAHDYDKLGLVVMELIFTIKQLRELAPKIVEDAWRCSSDEDHALDDMLDAVGCDLASSPHQAAEELRDLDLRQYLPDDLLRKVDTASMAAGLEVRCPFLDRDLARAALSMPIEQLMPGGRRKGLLRNIARKYLPRQIVDRPKMGFAIPIGEWFRSDYGGMKTLLLDHLHSAEPFGPIDLNRKAVQRFIDEHMTGKRDHGQRLFTLLTLSIWARSVSTQRKA